MKRPAYTRATTVGYLRRCLSCGAMQRYDGSLPCGH